MVALQRNWGALDRIVRRGRSAGVSLGPTVWGSGPPDVYMAGRTLTELFSTDKAVVYHSTGDGRWTALQLPLQYGVTRIDVIWDRARATCTWAATPTPTRQALSCTVRRTERRGVAAQGGLKVTTW